MTGPSPSDRGDSHRFLLVFLLFLFALNLFIFLPCMSGDFLWDDKYFISENPALLGSRFLSDFWRSPFGGFSGTDENSIRLDRERQFYRPLTSVSYWLDFKIWGLNPAAFHLTNILFQAVNSVLLLFILFRIGLGREAAFSGALLFSVFPLHFENVAWISGRTDLLSFFLGALSTVFFLRYLEKTSRISLGLSALLFLGGLFCKENIIVLPAIFLLVLWNRKPKPKEILLCSGAFLMSAFIWLALRRVAFGAVSVDLSSRSLLDFLAAIGFYAARTVFPFDLSVTIDAAQVFRNWCYIVLGTLLATLFAVSIFLMVRQKRDTASPHLVFLIYVLLLLPAIAVVLSSLSISLMGWRFLYLPSAVFVAALAYVFLRKIRPRGIGYMLVVFFAIAYAAEVYPKSRLFGRDEAGFWLGVRKVEREDVIARFNIGIKTLPHDEGRALEIFDKILSQKDHPLYPMWKTRIYEELAIYFAFQRDFAKAEHYFSELFNQPGGLSLHATFNYSYYLAFADKRKEGEKIVQDLIGRYPRNHYVLTRAARFYLIVKDYPGAAKLYERDYALFRNDQTRRYLEELRLLLGTKER